MNVGDASIYNFDPDYIGEKIAGNDWGACWDYLGKILENLSPHASTMSMALSVQLQENMKDEQGKQYARDFGSLLGELFLYLLTTPESRLSDKNFQQLIYYHETLHTLFQIYDLHHTDAIVKERLEKHKKEIPSTEQKKLLLLLSMDGQLDIVGILKSMSALYRMAAFISYFGYRKIFRQNVYENKIKLYALRHEYEKSYTDDDAFTKTIVGYFQSSYLNIPEKHIVKENVNAACRNYLSRISKELKKLKEEAGSRSFNFDKARPVILIVAEVFARNSPMYRGWGKMMIALHKEFNVVFTMPRDKADPALAQDFENFIPFHNFGDLYQIISAVQPDIIFMPSIGMRFYNVLVSNMRSAPIQIMGLGHPATTMSDQIDYVVSPEGLYDRAAFPKDTYIDDGYPEKHVPLLTKEQFFRPPAAAKPGPKKIIKVGVAGSDIKVSYPFFRLLKEITETSPFEIHLTFIIATAGVDTLYLEKFLRENFQNITVHGWQKYEDYIETIKSVDIVLNQFPFGHTNTVIDTLMCGKPCVGLDGIEPSSKTEGDVLEKVGLKDAFVAQSEEEYKEKFFSLAARILNGETEFFDRDQVYDRIFADFGDYDYSKIIRWIYDNHDAMKKSGGQYFKALSAL